MTIEAQRTSSTSEPLDASTLGLLEEAIGRGDHEAFARLHEALTPRVYARLAAVVDEARATTLTVQLLVRTWEVAPTLRSQGRSIAAWALAQSCALAGVLRPAGEPT